MSVSISGTVYTDRGTTTMGSGRTLNVSVNGAASAGSTTTAADGTYTISGLTVASGDVLTVYLQGNTEIGAVVTRGTGSNMAGVDVWGNCLVVRSDDGSAFTGANLVTSKTNAATGITLVYLATNSTTIAVVAPCDFVIAAGHTYSQASGTCTFRRGVYLNGTLSGSVSFSGNNQGSAGDGAFVSGGNTLANSTPITLSKSGNTVTLGDNLATSGAGTISCSAGTLGDGGKTLTFTGTACTFTGAGTFTLTGSVVLNCSSNANLTPPPSNSLTGLTCQAAKTFTLTTNNLTVTSSLAINSGSTLSLAGKNLTTTGATTAVTGTLKLGGTGTVTGSVTGGSGGGTLSYSGHAGAVTVTATAQSTDGIDATATGVSGSISKFAAFVGPTSGGGTLDLSALSGCTDDSAGTVTLSNGKAVTYSGFTTLMPAVTSGPARGVRVVMPTPVTAD